MTVNISVQTDDISILCADSRATVESRHFDGVRRLMVLEKEKYALAICGAGNRNTIQLVFDTLNEIEADSLEDCVNGVFSALKSEWDGNRKNQMDSYMRKKYEKLTLRNVEQDSQLGEYITGEILQQFYKSLQKQWATFLIHAIDKEKETREIYFINPESLQETAYPIVCLGSGQEGATHYLSKAIPYKEVQLSEEELLYHVLAAYAHSTEYTGVGGIPPFAIYSEGTITAYGDSDGCISANLVNASIAGVLPKEKVISALGKIISKEPIEPFLDELVKEYGDQLGVTAVGLSTLPIPYSAWDYRAKALDKEKMILSEKPTKPFVFEEMEIFKKLSIPPTPAYHHWAYGPKALDKKEPEKRMSEEEPNENNTEVEGYER